MKREKWTEKSLSLSLTLMWFSVSLLKWTFPHQHGSTSCQWIYNLLRHITETLKMTFTHSFKFALHIPWATWLPLDKSSLSLSLEQNISVCLYVSWLGIRAWNWTHPLMTLIQCVTHNRRGQPIHILLSTKRESLSSEMIPNDQQHWHSI